MDSVGINIIISLRSSNSSVSFSAFLTIWSEFSSIYMQMYIFRVFCFSEILLEERKYTNKPKIIKERKDYQTWNYCEDKVVYIFIEIVGVFQESIFNYCKVVFSDLNIHIESVSIGEGVTADFFPINFCSTAVWNIQEQLVVYKGTTVLFTSKMDQAES